MKKETLQQANELAKLEKEYQEALNCFEWAPDIDQPEKVFSTNPRLIIEFDGGDGREQVALPMVLSDALVNLLKQEIKANLSATQHRFQQL